MKTIPKCITPLILIFWVHVCTLLYSGIICQPGIQRKKKYLYFLPVYLLIYFYTEYILQQEHSIYFYHLSDVVAIVNPTNQDLSFHLLLLLPLHHLPNKYAAFNNNICRAKINIIFFSFKGTVYDRF